MTATDDEFGGVEFSCPNCGSVLDQYYEQCPQCGSALDEELSATYRPVGSPVAKVIAWILLIVVVLIPLAAALAYLLLR